MDKCNYNLRYSKLSHPNIILILRIPHSAQTNENTQNIANSEYATYISDKAYIHDIYLLNSYNNIKHINMEIQKYFQDKEKFVYYKSLKIAILTKVSKSGCLLLIG